MSEYVLLLRGGDDNFQTLSDDDMRSHLATLARATQLRDDDGLIDAAKLDRTGRNPVRKAGEIQVIKQHYR